MSKPTEPKKPTPTKISDLISDLEAKVDRLRDGGDDLEDSIRLYKEGMELAKQCEKRLKDARLEIEKIGVPEDEGAPEPSEADKNDRPASTDAKQTKGGLDLDN
ncbi:MAG: exodeoxyribonuclease VII small subunit [Gammaproteobacteria bacterium]|nr:exodeoxyribonuclease VII small subunit [Pseudomonadota bacterium]MCH9662624.1 exodeoxyribonuclease VII small subunit [Gammaproteobacteria bacterium]